MTLTKAQIESYRRDGTKAVQLMESHSVRLYHDHLLVKEAYTAQATPWHQDQPSQYRWQTKLQYVDSC